MIRSRAFTLLLMLPAVVFLIIIIIYPMFFSLGVSFIKWDSATIPEVLKFIGFGNYLKVLSDPDFSSILSKSLIFTISTVLLQLAFGIIIAIAINSQYVKHRNIFITIFLIPMAISPTVAGVIWRSLLESRNGLINVFLRNIGLPTPFWFANPNLALTSLILVDVWQWTSFTILLISAALLGVPKEPIEAASVDGASVFRVYWNIILPVIRPIIMIVILLRTMEAFKLFDLIYMLTGGGPGVSTYLLSFKIYKLGLNNFKMGEATALSYILNIIILIISSIYLRFFRKAIK